MKFIDIATDLPPEVREVVISFHPQNGIKIEEVIAWDNTLLLRAEDYEIIPIEKIS